MTGKMTITDKNLLRVLLTLILAAALLASCSVADDLDNPEKSEEFANYLVSGYVYNPDGEPIEGIQVIADHSPAGYDIVMADTLYTSKDGAFSKNLSTYPVNLFVVTFNDIDGALNGGEHESRSYQVNPVAQDTRANYRGSYLVYLPEVTLKLAE